MTTSREENLKNHVVPKEDYFLYTKDQLRMAEDIKAIIPTESLIEDVKVPINMLDEYFVPFFINTVVLPSYKEDPEQEMNDEQKNLQSMLKFTYDYYSEVIDFQSFMKSRYSKKKDRLLKIGNKKIKSDVLEFKSKYPKKHGTDQEKTSKYSKMVFGLIEKLEKNPNFQRMLIQDLMPEIKYCFKLRRYFGDGLYLFKKDLEYLDKIVDFKTLKSIEDLIGYIEYTKDKLELHLSVNSKVNGVYSCNLTQFARYEILSHLLKNVSSDLTLKILRRIMKDPNYEAFYHVIHDFGGSIGRPGWDSPHGYLRFGCLYNFLINVESVPKLNEFDKLAPILYQISQKKSFSGIVATDLLKELLKIEIMQPQDVAKCLSYKNSIINFHICNDRFTNYVLSYFLYNFISWENLKKILTEGSEKAARDVRWQNFLLLDLLMKNPKYTENIFSDPRFEEVYNKSFEYYVLPQLKNPMYKIFHEKRSRNVLQHEQYLTDRS